MKMTCARRLHANISPLKPILYQLNPKGGKLKKEDSVLKILEKSSLDYFNKSKWKLMSAVNEWFCLMTH